MHKYNDAVAFEAGLGIVFLHMLQNSRCCWDWTTVFASTCSGLLPQSAFEVGRFWWQDVHFLLAIGSFSALLIRVQPRAIAIGIHRSIRGPIVVLGRKVRWFTERGTQSDSLTLENGSSSLAVVSEVSPSLIFFLIFGRFPWMLVWLLTSISKMRIVSGFGTRQTNCVWYVWCLSLERERTSTLLDFLHSSCGVISTRT